MEWWRWTLAVLGFVGFTWLLTRLLKEKLIAKGSYTTALIFCLILTLALVRVDSIGKVEGAGFSMTLQEMKEIKQDVYAKAEAVQNLANEVAMSSLDLISVGNSSGTVDWVGLGVEKIVDSRDRSIRILQQAGVNPEKIEELRRKYYDEICRRMARDIYYVLGYRNSTGINPNLAAKYLHATYNRGEFEAELKKLNQWDTNIAELFKPLEYFEKHQTLPTNYSSSTIVKWR